MVPDDTGRPSSCIGGSTSTAKPWRAPCSCRKAGEPMRFLPKWKSNPTAAPATPYRSTRNTPHEFLRRQAGQARASKVSTIAPSSPVAASRRSFPVSSVSRNMGCCGRRMAAGCGSKVSAAAGQRAVLARATAAAITARWPRCTPSKLPMAITAPRSASAGALSRRTTKGFAGGRGSVIGQISPRAAAH